MTAHLQPFPRQHLEPFARLLRAVLLPFRLVLPLRVVEVDAEVERDVDEGSHQLHRCVNRASHSVSVSRGPSSASSLRQQLHFISRPHRPRGDILENDNAIFDDMVLARNGRDGVMKLFLKMTLFLSLLLPGVPKNKRTFRKVTYNN